MRNMKNMIVVYGKCGGVATVATFVGNQWWITSRDERLEPLYSGEPFFISNGKPGIARIVCSNGIRVFKFK